MGDVMSEVPPSVPAFLFSEEIMESITAEEGRGIYTAERLRFQKPEIYSACIELLGRGMSQASISKALHIHHRSVAAVCLAEPLPIDAVRLRTGRLLMLAGTLQLERLIDSPDMVPANVAALAATQLLDKAQLFTGGATQIVERRDGPGKLSPEEFARLLNSLPAADARVISTTGLSGGENCCNGAGDGVGDQVVREVGSDLESVGLPEGDDDDTRDDSRGLRVDPSSEEGGGGGRF